MFEAVLKHFQGVSASGGVPLFFSSDSAKSETLFIQELEPTVNVNVGSEKLMLYYLTLVFFLSIVYC